MFQYSSTPNSSIHKKKRIWVYSLFIIKVSIFVGIMTLYCSKSLTKLPKSTQNNSLFPFKRFQMFRLCRVNMVRDHWFRDTQ